MKYNSGVSTVGTRYPCNVNARTHERLANSKFFCLPSPVLRGTLTKPLLPLWYCQIAKISRVTDIWRRTTKTTFSTWCAEYIIHVYVRRVSVVYSNISFFFCWQKKSLLYVILRMYVNMETNSSSLCHRSSVGTIACSVYRTHVRFRDVPPA